MQSIRKNRHLLAVLAVVLIGAAEAALFQSSSSSSSQTTSFIRLRANKLRRPELCRENLPRKYEELPALVITGRVREVYLAGEQQPSAGATTTATTTTTNKALVSVGRVLKGNQQLLGTDIIVSGFNASTATPCPNYVKQNDSLILLLKHDADKRYSIQANNILSMSLANLDRINALVNDEPLKRRPPIEDILCEAHYCAYGRCTVLDERLGQLSCACPTDCPTSYAPVCASDGSTYQSECHLIREGCRQKRPLFVTREGAC